MKKLVTAVLPLLILALLAGCAMPEALIRLRPRTDAGDTAEGLSIYRVAAPGAEGGELIRREACPSDITSASDPGEFLALFAAPSRSQELSCALPQGVAVEDWHEENGVVTLELSESFLDLSDMDRTVTAFCAALTLCQAEGVEAVTVISGGQALFTGLMPEDALLNDGVTDPYVRQLRLYFPDSDGRYLISEYHSLTLDEDTSPERYVIEELLRGPNNGELQSVIPAGTSLISCSTADGLCTVDLSAAFYDNRPRTALGERLVIYSLVNSLTALAGVDRVMLLVEGQPVDAYVYRSLAEPLTRYDEPVGPVSPPKGELDTDLYLPLPGLESITPLPFRVSTADHTSQAEAVLDALLSAEEPGYPSVLPGAGSVLDAVVEGSLCTVDLSESFFVSLPETARNTAIQSIAATLCALPDIAAVRYTIGGADAVFDGVEWAGPWRTFDEIEVP